jgi:hypothetical protein
VQEYLAGQERDRIATAKKTKKTMGKPAGDKVAGKQDQANSAMASLGSRIGGGGKVTG